MRLALDHLTIADANPVELADLAFKAGYAAICPFLHSMDVLPNMPSYDLVHNKQLRSHFIDQLERNDLSVDIAYPFTLSRHTRADDFADALDCAKDIKARQVNVLIYERDLVRRKENMARFCERASSLGLRVAVEFFPASQIMTLEQALELVEYISDANLAGINIDLLHLMRSGGSITDVDAIPPKYIAYAQICDGLEMCPSHIAKSEASEERLLPGEGCFDIHKFVKTLPAECQLSIEVPRKHAFESGVSKESRAIAAANAAKQIIGN